MAEISKIIEKIENFAPPELASKWDNSGWQVNLGNKTTNKILLALTITKNVLEQAIKNKCDLIISHHPLLFEKFNRISHKNKTISLVIEAIQNNIQVYSAHTNLDSCQGGIADKLAELLNLQNIIIPDYLEDAKFVRIGKLRGEKSLDNFVLEVKNTLNISYVNLINNCNKTKVSKIAVIPGNGASLIPQIKDVDVLITGDVKYHNALEAENFAVLDAGHLETETIIFPALKTLLSEFEAEVLIAEESPAWKTL